MKTKQLIAYRSLLVAALLTASCSLLTPPCAAQGLFSTLEVQKSVKLGTNLTLGTISPSQLTADTDDWAPTNFSTAFAILVSTDASHNLTGIAGGAAGRTITLENVGSFPLVLTNADTASTAANRFALSADYTLAAGAGILLKYDATSSRWRMIGNQTAPNSATGDVVGPSSATDNAVARFDSTTGKLLQNSLLILSDAGAFTFPAGVKQTFAPDATNAGLNVGSYAGVPSSLADGDIFYDSTASALKARINGSTVSLGAGGGGGGGGGTLTLKRWIATDNQPPASNYATFNTRNSIAILQFDASTAESAVFVGIVPEGADFTTGITVRIIWTATSATSGDVIWTSAFERSNTDLDSDSFATGVDSSAATTNGTSGIVTVTSINHSGSDIDGMTAGDLFRLKITRKAADSGDTMTGDAEIIAVEIQQR